MPQDKVSSVHGVFGALLRHHAKYAGGNHKDDPWAPHVTMFEHDVPARFAGRQVTCPLVTLDWAGFKVPRTIDGQKFPQSLKRSDVEDNDGDSTMGDND